MGLIEAGSEREGLTRVDGGGGWDLWVITQGDTDTEEKQGLPEPTHTHTHRCLLSAASVMVRLIWLPLRKSVCFHTTLCSAKANVLNIHWVLLSISKTHTALGADKHWFLVLTEPRVGIEANISKLGCSEKISTSYELEFSLWEFPANFSKFVMRTVKYS